MLGRGIYEKYQSRDEQYPEPNGKLSSRTVKGKNGKYDCYIKRTTDNVLQIFLQASRWRVKTANTILQIPWKKAKSYANTPT
jgi:hypothetical protein